MHRELFEKHAANMLENHEKVLGMLLTMHVVQIDTSLPLKTAAEECESLCMRTVALLCARTGAHVPRELVEALRKVRPVPQPLPRGAGEATRPGGR